MENAQPILHMGHHTIKKQVFYTESNLKEPDSSQKRSARPRPPEAAPGGDPRFPTWGSGPGALGPSLLLLPRAAAGPALLPARQPGLRGMSTTRLRRPRYPLTLLRRRATARPAPARRRPGGAGRASPQPGAAPNRHLPYCCQANGGAPAQSGAKAAVTTATASRHRRVPGGAGRCRHRRAPLSRPGPQVTTRGWGTRWTDEVHCGEVAGSSGGRPGSYGSVVAASGAWQGGGKARCWRPFREGSRSPAGTGQWVSCLPTRAELLNDFN